MTASLSLAENLKSDSEPTPSTKHGLYAVPVVLFVASRALLAVVAWSAPHLLTPLRINRPDLPHTDPLAAVWSWTSPWFRFDARWYVDVAVHGYRWADTQHTNTNFFPLFPILIRTVEPLTLGSPWAAALLVANLGFLGALIVLYRWAILRWDRRVAFRVTLLTATFPFAFFFAAPYAEPLFLLLAVSAFYLAERDRWWLAAVAAGLSTVTRPVGVAVVLALIVLALSRREPGEALTAATGFLPFIAFVAYLGFAFGHPLGFAVYHTYGWVPPHGGLLTTISSQFHTKLSPFDRIDAAISLLFLAAALPVWKRVGGAYALYVLLGVLLPLARSLAGMERYVIVLFPSFAAWATSRTRLLQPILFSLFLMGLILATAMFADGYSIF